VNAPVDPARWTCPLPLRDYAEIVLGHGGGGQLSAELVEHLFVPAFGTAPLAELGDAAVVDMPPGRLALTTDSFVVRPLFFPGGDIGSLAVHGTVNDLAMRGARPIYLTAGFILEEGLPLETLGRIVHSMAAAARRASVEIVAGDTKVVERGHGDGLYVNMAGVGVVPGTRIFAASRVQTGDAIIVSGTLGDHGMAIMSVRDGLAFDTPIVSDSAALHELVEVMVATAGDVHLLRDPTRGGVAAVLNEVAKAARVSIELDERAIPVGAEVRAACEILGLDPLLVANEGKLIACVSASDAERVLAAMRRHPLGADAARVGEVVAGPPGRVVVRTAFGTRRVVPMPVGEQLPRIC
jgi:hydrogenase expression/formation protein HypE